MRPYTTAISLIAAGMLALPAFAQEPQTEDGDSARRPILRERIMRAFDRNNDGDLNEEELAAMRDQLGDRFDEIRERMRERRSDQDEDRERDRDRPREADGERDRGPASREGDRGPEGRRDSVDASRGEARRDSDQPRRDAQRPREERAREERRIRLRLRGGPEVGPGPGLRGPLGPLGGPPDRSIQALFAWFDTDGDNMLSRREFAELSRFVEERRPGRPAPGGPARIGRRGPAALPSRGDEIRPPVRRERLERALRDETRRRDGRDERRPERPDAPRPEDPPRPPRDSDRSPPDPI